VGRAALRTGLDRVVLGSSTGVYGGTAAAAIDEKAPATPDSPYRASKRDAEQVLLALHEAEGLSVAIARPSSMVGWRSSGWLRLCGAISTGRFRLVGQGRNRVHLCPVADAIAGLELCGEVPAADGEAFILCADRPTTARGLVPAFAEELGVPGPVGSLPAAPFRVMRAVSRLGIGRPESSSESPAATTSSSTTRPMTTRKRSRSSAFSLAPRSGRRFATRSGGIANKKVARPPVRHTR
jgi:nucleoside-diphosphate-sugar epimerase